jgi:hypothetical protein
MWDDIIYGTGEKLSGAVKVFGLETTEDISQNSESYWISNCYLGVGMTVFKDTEQGREITEYIKNVDSNGLSEYLTELVFAGLANSVLREKIGRYGDFRFREGVEDCQKKLRQQLGLH